VYTKLLILVILALLTACLFVATGCDKLTTQVNNNTYYDSTLAEACFKCHGDGNNVIAQPKGQWVNSAHASGDLIEAVVRWDSTFYLTSQCGPQCHTSEGFIKYADTRTTPAQGKPSAIDCFTCHMPHTGEYGTWSMDTLRGYIKPLTLINNVDYDMGKSQQCAVCHQASAYANINGTSGTVKLDSLGPRGTHSGADAQILLGTSGYLFGQLKDSASHRSTFSIGGCLSCHFGPANGTDSSGSGYEFGEHTFRLQRDDGTQYTANCNATGCHGGLTNFYTVLPHRVDSIAHLGDSLGGRLLALGLLKPGGDSSEYYKDSIVPTDAARILYNYQLYKNDHSHGVHNAKYILQLLKVSLARVDSIPQGSIAISGADTGCAPFNVQFSSAVNGSVTSYLWDFGDGNTSTEATPNHAYGYVDSGKYVATLTVSGTAGKRTVKAPTMVVVRDTLLKPAFTATPGDSGSVDSLKVTFTNTSQGVITGYAWDFGDGVGTSNAVNPVYTFNANDTFYVKLTLTGLCKTAIDSVRVILPKPTSGILAKRRP
jgi:hypothetical protein